MLNSTNSVMPKGPSALIKCAAFWATVTKWTRTILSVTILSVTSHNLLVRPFLWSAAVESTQSLNLVVASFLWSAFCRV